MSDTTDTDYGEQVEQRRQRRNDRHRRDDAPNSVQELLLAQDPWIATVSGEWISVGAPEPEKIRITDIAHGLAREYRFANQFEGHYSVADHCCVLARCVPAGLALKALLHDAAEAYTGDLTKPVKRLCSGFDEIEARFLTAIGVSLGLPGLQAENPVLKIWDRNLFAIEAKRFYKLPGDGYLDGGPEVGFDWEDYRALQTAFDAQREECQTRTQSYYCFLELFAILSSNYFVRSAGACHLAEADAEYVPGRRAKYEK